MFHPKYIRIQIFMSVLYLLPLADDDDNSSIVAIIIPTSFGAVAIIIGFAFLVLFLYIKSKQYLRRRYNLEIGPQSIQVTTQRTNHARVVDQAPPDSHPQQSSDSNHQQTESHPKEQPSTPPPSGQLKRPPPPSCSDVVAN